LFVVLGMHRAGTSALSRVVAAGGAALPKHLLPANPHNSRGYFESGEINMVNTVRLHGSGSAWDDPLPRPYPEWPAGEDLKWRELARRTFEQEFGDASAPLMKDPRLSLTLPAWRPVFAELGLEPRCVIAVRDPAAVAASLLRREGFSAEKSLLLWASHMTAAVANTGDLARIFVSYDALLADWRREAARLETGLGLQIPQDRSHPAGELDAFLTAELRHNPGGGDLTRFGWAGELAADVRRALAGALDGGEPDLAVLAAAEALLTAKRREWGPIISSISRDLDRARHEIARSRPASPDPQ
jgi:hypothetical protein